MELTDQQWTIIEPLFEEKQRPDGRGRPWRDARAVLNGVLWVLRTGAPWQDLPDRYPPRLIGDRAYDSDRLDAALWTSFGIELIAPPSGRPQCAPRRTAGRPGATSGAGWSNGSLPGCTTRGGSSRAGSGTSRTSWPCCSSHACVSCSTVYEIASKPLATLRSAANPLSSL